MFTNVLLAIGLTPEEASKYSMHSWRVYLACALLDAGASNATIQALLRWKSDEALKIYARMNKHTYADHLAKAGQAKVDSVRTTSLQRDMEVCGSVEGAAHAAFRYAWIKQAGGATVRASMLSDCPTVDDQDARAAIHDGMDTLRQLAETQDD